MPRAVIFTEIDSLPGSQYKPSVVYDDLLGESNHAGFQMCRRVPFHVKVTIFPGYDFVNFLCKILNHIGIRIFIDGDRRGRMRTNTVQIPSFTPLSDTAFCISRVISCISVCCLVITSSLISILFLTPLNRISFKYPATHRFNSPACMKEDIRLVATLLRTPA